MVHWHLAMKRSLKKLEGGRFNHDEVHRRDGSGDAQQGEERRHCPIEHD